MAVADTDGMFVTTISDYRTVMAQSSKAVNLADRPMMKVWET
jgi:hypothetical protein